MFNLKPSSCNKNVHSFSHTFPQVLLFHTTLIANGRGCPGNNACHGGYFSDNILKYIYSKYNYSVWFHMLLIFISDALIDDNSALVQHCRNLQLPTEFWIITLWPYRWLLSKITTTALLTHCGYRSLALCHRYDCSYSHSPTNRNHRLQIMKLLNNWLPML